MTENIELRSDTFTQPSPAMRQAMASAEVGDDVWGEDPTVKRLEQRVADLLGKEAALFVPSGSMANQVALLCHTTHGDQVLVGWRSHCITYEAGAGAALSGVMFQVLGGPEGFDAEQAQQAIPPGDVHFAPARLVWLENTHNAAGGRITPLPQVEAIARVARQHGMALHLDGARLLNAAVATGLSPAQLVAAVDSSSICLSKGLGAPVGSVLAGSAQLMGRARRYRKMLGGAMRQVGVLAAAGLYALEHNVERLAEDHDNARLLAQRLAALPGVLLDPASVHSNIVIFALGGGSQAVERLVQGCRERGLRLAGAGGDRVRAVTHMDVSREQILAAAEIVERVLTGS